METVAERFDTTRQTMLSQLGAFTDRTREAGLAFATETREAGSELARAARGEAEAWTRFFGERTRPLLAEGPSVPEVDVPALERRLLVGLRDLLGRLDSRLQSRLEDPRPGQPPLEGYDALPAKAIVGMLAELEPATVAAVASYEAAHKGRKTILRATERQAA
ncbi:MAG: hypothetical protein CMN30_13890 [Sandaracinus sp.]|nr:hypothetical protein [Sandaracinus sp.]